MSPARNLTLGASLVTDTIVGAPHAFAARSAPVRAGQTRYSGHLPSANPGSGRWRCRYVDVLELLFELSLELSSELLF